MDAALRRYYAAARRVVEAYGGTVEKFIGDAVVAVFGVPVAHEDDPERAVRAALRLVDEVDALPAVGGRPLEVRVGVNTGEALVRLDVDPASGEGFLTGDSVNVAARLQAAAPPGAVAVGEATHAATEKVFAFDACHPVALKGKSEPLRAWLATAPLARTGAELRSFSTRFVGREDELAALEGLLDGAVAAGAPRLGLIVGEPGIGKSRLLAELSGRLDDRPDFVVWRQGRCLPFGSGVTFWALSEIVRACAGILESDGVARAEARLETVLPGDDERDRVRARLRPLLGLEAEEASRDENFAVWRTFLEGLAVEGPAVIVVEDLHWADEGLLDFMDFLAFSTASVPLVVLATARPEVLELTGAGSGFVAVAERVALGPLSGDETSALVLACLGAKALPVALQARLLEASGGNPLFAEELVRLLQDRDLLVTRGGQTQLKEGAELPTPDSIGALIAARLDLLSPERKALLADAAVVGRTFWAGAVAAVGAHDPAEVFEGLHELVAKELVRPERSSAMEGETEFVFVHALVRDVAYGQLTRADRAAKHAALARWLEGRTAGRTEDLAEILAFHFGTALEMASSCGLFDLEDELAEPTTRYLELAGGRAAPLDAAAAAAHFARAERVADEAAKPKRRFFLSRKTRRTLRRRAPLLAAAAAVIAVAAVAALAIWVFQPHHEPRKASGPAKLTESQIAQKYGSSIVRITTKTPMVKGTSLQWTPVSMSGVVVSKDGFIYTCGKAFSSKDLRDWGPALVTVEYHDDLGQYHKVSGAAVGDGVVGVVKISAESGELHPIPLGDSDALKEGAWVVTMNRSGNFLAHASGTLLTIDRSMWAIGDEPGDKPQKTKQEVVDAMRTSADLPLPATGGALVDSTGRLVGVMGPLKVVGYTGRNVALGIQYAKQLVSGFRAAGRDDSSQAWLGVLPTPEKAGLALGTPRDGGTAVQVVSDGSPAAKAGIVGGRTVKEVGGQPYVIGGDVIVAVNGERVRTGEDLIRILQGMRPGESASITLLRGGSRTTVNATLAPRPSLAQ